MQRKLLLIINDGGVRDCIPGVHIDKKHYLSFFKSPNGGSWSDNEIFIYDTNCMADVLRCVIHNHSDVEYWLIVFCGPGKCVAGDTILELSPGHELKVSLLKSWLCATRCTLIVDGCCCLILNNEFIGTKGNSSQSQKFFSKETSFKEIYNAALMKLPKSTFNYAFSSSLNENSYENDKDGGCYSASIIYELESIINSHSNNLLNIVYLGSVHERAARRVAIVTNGEQHPLASIGIVDVPFIVMK